MFNSLEPNVPYINNITTKDYKAKGIGLEIGLFSLFPKFHTYRLWPDLALDMAYFFEGIMKYVMLIQLIT